MSSRNGASNDESRGQDSSGPDNTGVPRVLVLSLKKRLVKALIRKLTNRRSTTTLQNEESTILSNIRVLSRLPGRPLGRFRATVGVANMPATNGSQAPAPSSSATPSRRQQRHDRDRLFWTLMGSSSRLSTSRSRARASSQARAARQSPFPDLLEPDHNFTPLVARRYPSFGVGSSSGRQVILLRATENQPAADPADGTTTAATQVSDEVEEPINMSAGAMTLEEDVAAAREPAPAPPAAEPDAAPPACDEEPSTVPTEDPDYQSRRKRKREVTGDTHESVAVLNQSLLRLLECPVCMEWMEPPIAQCRRGHLVCSACRARLEACPVCRTSFSSVRNRAMEDVAAILRYPCRHGCGREVRTGRRARHEASCVSRRYACPLPACAAAPTMALMLLRHHCQTCHPEHFRIGSRQRVSLRVNCEQHQHWCVAALDQLFHARVDVDVRTWGVVVYVAFVGPQNLAKNYTYEVTVMGRHHSRKLTYKRSTHSDLENSAMNSSRQDCFHLSLDQALNFLRFKNEHSETDKTLECTIVIAEMELEETREISDSGGANA